MSDSGSAHSIGRRELLLGAGVAALVALVSGVQPMLAVAKDAETNGWEGVIARLVGEQAPIEGKIAFDVPEIAENGNTVPFSVTVDSPMDEANYVKAVHVLATANPQPSVATFHFHPASGKAAAASRMRLAETQNVICLAELSDGKFAIAKKMVKVTIGGCGG